MKKLLTKISFCAIVLLSGICFCYINTIDFSMGDNNSTEITEVPETNDRLVGSVKAATIMFSKVIDILAHRGEA